MAQSLLIINDGARQADPSRFGELTALLTHVGHPAEVVATKSREEATQVSAEAAARGVDRLWAAGGDGTMNSVLPGLANSKTALCLVPWGTGNIMARELGLDLDWKEAVAQQASGVPKQMDLGVCNGRHFALFVSAGVGHEIIENVSSRLKRVSGRAAFVLSAIQVAWRHRPFEYSLAVDGEDIVGRTWDVICANTAKYTSVIDFRDYVSPYDGAFDLNIVASAENITHEAPKPRVFWHALRYMASGAKFPEVQRIRCSRITLSTDPPVGVQMDGEKCGTTPIEIQMLPGALTVCLPPSARAGSF